MKTRTKKWIGPRTKPLLVFLSGLHPEGLSLSTLSQELKMSIPAVSYMFRTDNMHLSRAEYIARIYGYSLHLEYRYSGVYPPYTEYHPSTSTMSNLSGIDEYCKRMNRSLHFVANSVGLHRDSLAKALAKGDILLSTLYTITDGLGLEVKWSFIPIIPAC